MSPFVSLSTKSPATLSNATRRPSALMAGAEEKPLPLPQPALLTLIKVVVPVFRSRTKTSKSPFASSSATKSVAKLSNATKRPSALMAGAKEKPLPLPVPALLALTRVVVPVFRSRTKTSKSPFASSGTKSVARLSNATKRPSALMAGAKEKPLPLPVPAPLALTSTVSALAACLPEPRAIIELKVNITAQEIVRVFILMQILFLLTLLRKKRASLSAPRVCRLRDSSAFPARDVMGSASHLRSLPRLCLGSGPGAVATRSVVGLLPGSTHSQETGASGFADQGGGFTLLHSPFGFRFDLTRSRRNPHTPLTLTRSSLTAASSFTAMRLS